MASPKNSTLIWLRPEPSDRQPRHTRDQIARAAITIADEAGFDAVTMKRVAQELGAGTMTLYYYVSTKADLVALMQDAILADLIIPDGELPGSWRPAVAAIARRTRAVLLDHPWAITCLDQAQFGPNALRHYEQSLAALRATKLTGSDKVEITGILDDYVVGSATHAVETDTRAKMAAADPSLVRDAATYGQQALATGAYPEIAALAAAAAPGPPPGARMERQFEVGLDALLDGIARHYGISGRRR